MPRVASLHRARAGVVVGGVQAQAPARHPPAPLHARRVAVACVCGGNAWGVGARVLGAVVLVRTFTMMASVVRCRLGMQAATGQGPTVFR